MLCQLRKQFLILSLAAVPVPQWGLGGGIVAADRPSSAYWKLSDDDIFNESPDLSQIQDKTSPSDAVDGGNTDALNPVKHPVNQETGESEGDGQRGQNVDSSNALAVLPPQPELKQNSQNGNTTLALRTSQPVSDTTLALRPSQTGSEQSSQNGGHTTLALRPSQPVSEQSSQNGGDTTLALRPSQPVSEQSFQNADNTHALEPGTNEDSLSDGTVAQNGGLPNDAESSLRVADANIKRAMTELNDNNAASVVANNPVEYLRNLENRVNSLEGLLAEFHRYSRTKRVDIRPIGRTGLNLGEPPYIPRELHYKEIVDRAKQLQGEIDSAYTQIRGTLSSKAQTAQRKSAKYQVTIKGLGAGLKKLKSAVTQFRKATEQMAYGQAEKAEDELLSGLPENQARDVLGVYVPSAGARRPSVS